jgi:hypothetical protein
VEENRIEVTEDHLFQLTKGPVMLELYREEGRWLGNEPLGKGKLTITYGLKRQVTFGN